MSALSRIAGFVVGDAQADRAVPPSGFTANLTTFSAAAMAFLAVFALALSLATGRLADRWGQELARSSTLRISAPGDQIQTQTQAALKVLQTTPGVASARALSADEQRALLEPWFGPDLPLEGLPIPQLIEISEDSTGYDAAGLRLRLQAEVPGAVLDDHTRWRKPLIRAAGRLRALGWLSIALIGGALAAMITLAANAALAANARVIAVLRLVGATDGYIAQAFVRRFTLRGLSGAALGTALGMGAVAVLPAAQDTAGFLTGLGFQGAHWLVPLFIPLLAGAVAFIATRAAARKTLRELP
ncbi:cell division protein FtsX [Thalassobius vesicularis]|uniref:Cell division protein FtsX n=1 Tax=Thalassobius vesicularis TaxID=1294297 RepID=A0A4S3MF58_9RHOB|nr:FtsX-like permease family protein [Thalassobius vesicularis]THD76344.1 cell division protein FtsX [Thalassobius vesicularis]